MYGPCATRPFVRTVGQNGKERALVCGLFMRGSILNCNPGGTSRGAIPDGCTGAYGDQELTVLSTVALIAVASLAATDAEARSRRGHGAAIAAGVIGGLAVGALIGAAASNAYATPS